MLSTFPPDVVSGSPFSTFDDGFTPWESSSELFSIFQFPKSNSELNTGLSDIFFQSVKPVNSSSPNYVDQTRLNCSKESSLADPVMDERRLRRMISNRESAKRSRMRKQQQFESLRNQVNCLRNKKVEISNRLQFTLYHCHCVQTENDRLLSEHRVLHRRLVNIRQNLYFRQLSTIIKAIPTYNLLIKKQNHIGLLEKWTKNWELSLSFPLFLCK